MSIPFRPTAASQTTEERSNTRYYYGGNWCCGLAGTIRLPIRLQYCGFILCLLRSDWRAAWLDLTGQFYSRRFAFAFVGFQRYGGGVTLLISTGDVS
jgi:hypothetical protein